MAWLGSIADLTLQDHYIGVDVGTGSARACIIDETGDIKALASENIKLWQPENGYYVRACTLFAQAQWLRFRIS